MSLSTGCSKGNVKADKPLICPSTAYVDEKEYKLAPLQSKSDKEFHGKANEGFEKLAKLRNAYKDLRECVDDYSGRP